MQLPLTDEHNEMPLFVVTVNKETNVVRVYVLGPMDATPIPEDYASACADVISTLKMGFPNLDVEKALTDIGERARDLVAKQTTQFDRSHPAFRRDLSTEN